MRFAPFCVSGARPAANAPLRLASRLCSLARLPARPLLRSSRTQHRHNEKRLCAPGGAFVKIGNHFMMRLPSPFACGMQC